MTTHVKPPLRRRRLGRRLRALCESAGLTLEAAAPKPDLSRSSLFRVESGETRATVHLVRSMMDLYDRFEPDLLDAVRAAMKPSWFTAYGVLDMGYTDAETEAHRVWDYPGMLLPGLLHTEEYVRALFGHVHRRRSAEQMDNQVAVRRIRQQRLTSDDDPLELVALVDEAALTREFGGPGGSVRTARPPGHDGRTACGHPPRAATADMSTQRSRRRVHSAGLPRARGAGPALPRVCDRGTAHRG